jgi:hypothetical protein
MGGTNNYIELIGSKSHAMAYQLSIRVTQSNAPSRLDVFHASQHRILDRLRLTLL